MTTPLLPDTASADTFGGTFANEDAVVDPETEVDASYFNRMIVQLVMGSYTATRARARCTVSGGVVTLAEHSAVWGDTAPVAPTAARTSAGLFTLTWAATYDDLQATPEAHSVNIRFPEASAYKSGAAMITNVRRTAANVLEVTTYDDAGAATDPDEFTASF